MGLRHQLATREARREPRRRLPSASTFDRTHRFTLRGLRTFSSTVPLSAASARSRCSRACDQIAPIQNRIGEDEISEVAVPEHYSRRRFQPWSDGETIDAFGVRRRRCSFDGWTSVPCSAAKAARGSPRHVSDRPSRREARRLIVAPFHFVAGTPRQVPRARRRGWAQRAVVAVTSGTWWQAWVGFRAFRRLP